MNTAPKEKDPYILSSLDSALRILDILRVRNGLGVSEISKLSKTGKSSAYNMLYTLERRGYVTKTEDAKYFLGRKFFDNNFINDTSKSLSDAAVPEMKRLVKYTGETVWLAILNIHGRVVAINTEEGSSPVSAPGRLGLEWDSSCTAPGKILLSYLDQDVYFGIMKDKKFKQYTSYTIVDPELLNMELAEIRKTGFSTDFNERYVGFGNISVPVFDQSRKCIAALSIVGRTEVLKTHMDDYLDFLKNAAENITRLI